MIGGTPADIAGYPYAVSLRKLLKSGRFYPYCGGAIITETHIVTASHCLLKKRPEDLSIEMGKFNITGREPRNDPFIRKVVHMQRHFHYDKPTYNNDIAVVTLDKPVDFGRTTRPICLPPFGSDVLEGTKGEVVGWGRIAFKGKKSGVLNNVTLPVVNRTECQKPLKHRISTNMICAGGTAKRDACVGDSGGPMIIRSEKTHLLCGVVSFGKQCGLPNVYGVYTRVGLYTKFVYEQTLGAKCKPGVIATKDYRSIGSSGWGGYQITKMGNSL